MVLFEIRNLCLTCFVQIKNVSAINRKIRINFLKLTKAKELSLKFALERFDS